MISLYFQSRGTATQLYRACVVVTMSATPHGFLQPKQRAATAFFNIGLPVRPRVRSSSKLSLGGLDKTLAKRIAGIGLMEKSDGQLR